LSFTVCNQISSLSVCLEAHSRSSLKSIAFERILPERWRVRGGSASAGGAGDAGGVAEPEVEAPDSSAAGAHLLPPWPRPDAEPPRLSWSRQQPRAPLPPSSPCLPLR